MSASDRQRTAESIFVSCVYSMRDITYCLMYFGGSMVPWLQYNLSFKLLSQFNFGLNHYGWQLTATSCGRAATKWPITA